MARIPVVVSLLLASASASAQQEMMKKKEPAPAAAAIAPKDPAAPPAPPQPAAELDALKWMEGNWKCTGKIHANPMMGPEHATASTIKGKRDLDKFWIAFRIEGKKSKVDPMPWKGADHWSYDASQKKYTRVLVDNFGGWLTATSPGWEGDKMVWTGDMMASGQKMGFRQTFTKKSDRELSYTFEMADPKRTKWTTAGEDTCKK